LDFYAGKNELLLAPHRGFHFFGVFLYQPVDASGFAAQMLQLSLNGFGDELAQ